MHEKIEVTIHALLQHARQVKEQSENIEMRKPIPTAPSFFSDFSRKSERTEQKKEHLNTPWEILEKQKLYWDNLLIWLVW